MKNLHAVNAKYKTYQNFTSRSKKYVFEILNDILFAKKYKLVKIYILDKTKLIRIIYLYW